jgi:formylglycine-generating enzyme required for sulfatase activity
MTEKGRSDNEAAQMVTLKEDFYLGIYEVTQRQYELIAGNRPSSFKNDSCYSCRPVENLSVTAIRGSVSWPEGGHSVAGDSFMGILGARTGLYGFDLPTEAEWEFAARAGCGNALYNGKELTGNTTSDNLDDIARYRRNGGYATGASSEPASDSTVELGTAEVGSFDRNAYGLYDMLGNVWERCLDRYIDFPTVGELEAGGPGDRGSTSSRTIRGGSWKNDAASIRSASRNGVGATSSFNHTGFRAWRNAVVR